MLTYGTARPQTRDPAESGADSRELFHKMPETPEPRSLKLRADLVLVGVTMVWGSSFIVVKNVLREAPPLAFLSLRFLLAAALITPILPWRRRTPALLRDGMAAGLLLGVGMCLQVVGQVDTTASNAAFLTGLAVVLTPLAAYLRARQLPSLENGAGIVLASAGFFFLTVPSGAGSLGRGDLFVLASSVLFAFYVVELSLRAPAHDAVRMACVQLATVGMIAGVVSLLSRQALPVGVLVTLGESRFLPRSSEFLLSLAYLASIGTVGTFVGQTWAQRHMSATHAAILFALEPVFAAILAAWFLDERLGGRGIAGGSLVLAGIAVSELRLRRSGGETPRSVSK